MSANSSASEGSLIDQAVAWLEKRLPGSWAVEGSNVLEQGTDALPADSKISLKGPNGATTTVAVEERQSISPRIVLSLLSPRVQTARNMGAHLPLLVIAPWLSKRTRELLAAQEINYIDLTGNALLRVDNPPFYLQTVGSERNPAPKERGQAQLRGAKAARLIRLLADVRPPYGVRELAEAAGLAPGYVSRLLGTLYREALVERSPRGPVESVDVPGLLRRWASSYDVLRANRVETYVAPALPPLLSELANYPSEKPRFAITGSVAAARLAPVTAPAMLLAYCDSPAALAKELGLLPAEEGANVVLGEPFDPVVWQCDETEKGLRYAAPSQVAVDCLTGNGRMPAEGEALVSWMQENEDAWRLPSLDAWKSRAHWD